MKKNSSDEIFDNVIYTLSILIWVITFVVLDKFSCYISYTLLYLMFFH